MLAAAMHFFRPFAGDPERILRSNRTHRPPFDPAKSRWVDWREKTHLTRARQRPLEELRQSARPGGLVVFPACNLHVPQCRAATKTSALQFFH